MKPRHVLPVVLALLSCGSRDAEPGATFGPEVVLTVTARETVPVTEDEVARAAELLRFATFEGTEAHYRRLALSRIVLPRAAVRAAFPERRAEALLEAQRIGAQLVDGEAHPAETVTLGDLDTFGPLLVGLSLETELDTWSGLVENIGSFQFVRPLERATEEVHGTRLAVVTIPYSIEIRTQQDIDRYVDESVLEVLRPEFRDLIPTLIAHRMSAEGDKP